MKNYTCECGGKMNVAEVEISPDREDHVDIINKSSKQGNEKSSQTSIKSNQNPGSFLL